MKVSIHLCGRNSENSVLRWHLSVMKTKMRERHHLGLVLNLFFPSLLSPPQNPILFLNLAVDFALLKKSSLQLLVKSIQQNETPCFGGWLCVGFFLLVYF